MQDYLVVGLGLAGISLCEKLEEQGKTFTVISDESQQSSKVAGGLYNPVILKRFTAVWKAKEQLEIALPFYHKLEQKLKVRLDYKAPVLRRFASIEEQNMWFEAADKPVLQDFLSTKLLPNTNSNIDAPFGYGQVLGTGRIDTSVLVNEYSKYLLGKNILEKCTFNFAKLKVEENGVSYKSIRAKRIVYTTGFGLKNNPYFNYLPLNGTKGELLVIKASNLKEENVIKSSVFIIPLGKDLYRVGATYKWKDKTNTPTMEAKEELLQKLKTFLKCDFEVVNHKAGIRPTVADRRPLAGQHPQHKNVYVLNGMGSRGVMIAPWLAAQLFNNIEHGEPIQTEASIDRFTKKYFLQ